MMMVNIFYGKLYYTSLTEELAYGWMEALCEKYFDLFCSIISLTLA